MRLKVMDVSWKYVHNLSGIDCEIEKKRMCGCRACKMRVEGIERNRWVIVDQMESLKMLIT